MTQSLFALASAPGRAAIAVWRLSGPDVADAISALTGRPPPAPRLAALRLLRDPATGAPLDQALVLFMPGPASFTGEDMAELQTHGGRAVAEAIGGALARLPGFQEAEPGAFSRRAFLNGKFDLTTAEAIADLAAAETEAQRRQAMAQAGGALAALHEGWRDRLIRLRAHLDAAIEFPDEDIGDPVAGMAEAITELRVEVARHLADSRRGERLRDGLTIAIVGAPNAGKSSLMNALAQRDVAIVSPEAGTTRDAIEAHLDLGGFPVVLVDTAGLRAAESAIEAEGIARARARAQSADLVLALFAADAPDDAETLAMVDDRTIVVTSKADLAAPRNPLAPIAAGFTNRHFAFPNPDFTAEAAEKRGGRGARENWMATRRPQRSSSAYSALKSCLSSAFGQAWDGARSAAPGDGAGSAFADGSRAVSERGRPLTLPLRGGVRDRGAAIQVSSRTGFGVGALLDVLTARAADLLGDRGVPPPTRARHREALGRCLEALDAAQTAAFPELAAEELRVAADALGRISGRVDIEDVLDAIFRDFCIGK